MKQVSLMDFMPGPSPQNPGQELLVNWKKFQDKSWSCFTGHTGAKLRVLWLFHPARHVGETYYYACPALNLVCTSFDEINNNILEYAKSRIGRIVDGYTTTAFKGEQRCEVLE